MSRYFVNDPPVAIPEFEAGSMIGADGQPQCPNVIYIRSRMDVETRGKVRSELYGLAPDGKTPELRAGLNDMALLIYNIVRWEGPDLGQIPCAPANIRKLDPNDPHIARVLEEIALRNAPRKAPVPNSPAGNGFSSDGNPDSKMPAPASESVSLQLATSTPKSTLRSALDGRLNKSADSTPTT